MLIRFGIKALLFSSMLTLPYDVYASKNPVSYTNAADLIIDFGVVSKLREEKNKENQKNREAQQKNNNQVSSKSNKEKTAESFKKRKKAIHAKPKKVVISDSKKTDVIKPELSEKSIPSIKLDKDYTLPEIVPENITENTVDNIKDMIEIPDNKGQEFTAIPKELNIPKLETQPDALQGDNQGVTIEIPEVEISIPQEKDNIDSSDASESLKPEIKEVPISENKIIPKNSTIWTEKKPSSDIGIIPSPQVEIGKPLTLKRDKSKDTDSKLENKKLTESKNHKLEQDKKENIKESKDISAPEKQDNQEKDYEKKEVTSPNQSNTIISYTAGQIDLNGKQKAQIEKFIAAVEIPSKAKVRIVGYATDDGDNPTSRRVALQRVIEMRKIFLNHRFDQMLITVQAIGLDKSDSNLPKDRVELFVE